MARQGGTAIRTCELCIDIGGDHPSEELAQIHAGIEARDLLGIPVEQ
jgi:hypothetical protein